MEHTPTPLQPHQQRVVDEKIDLDTKLTALHVFMDTPLFRSLPEAEKARMRRQANAMRDYSRALGERIEAFA